MAGNSLGEHFVFYVYGAQGLLRQRVIDQIKSNVLKSQSAQLDIDVFYASEDDARKIVDCAKTVPFLVERRIILVKNFESADKEFKNYLKVYFESPSTFSILILESSDVKPQKDVISFSEIVKSIECNNLSRPELLKWIEGMFKKNNKIVSQSDVEIIASNIGSDLGLVEKSVESLCLYVGNSNKITRADIENIVGYSVEHTGFNLVDAIEKKDRKSAMFILRNLLKDVQVQKKPFELIGVLNWHYKRILSAKILLEKHNSDQAVVKRLNIPHFISERFIRQVKTLPRKKIEHIMRMLLEVDRGYKTGTLSDRDIESLVLNLTQP